MCESSGDLAMAVVISRSTDPVTMSADESNVHMRNFRSITTPHEISSENPSIGVDKTSAPVLVLDPSVPPSETMLSVMEMSPQQLATLYQTRHPLGFCRASSSDSVTKSLCKSALAPSEEQLSTVTTWVGNVCGDPPLRRTLNQFTDEDFAGPSDDLLFSVGSQIAFEIRLRLFERTGFTTSAGVAPNPMLAKLASSMYKPNQQSILRAAMAPSFLSPVSLSKITGFGPKSQALAEAAGIRIVGDVQNVPLSVLINRTQDTELSRWLFDIAHGIDNTPVEPTGAPKGYGQEKRQNVVKRADKLNLLNWLTSKLLDRIQDDEHDYNRRPESLILKWVSGDYSSREWAAQSRRCALPDLSNRPTADAHKVLYSLALNLLNKNIPDHVAIRCLGLSVTKFTPLLSQAEKRVATSINNFFCATPGPSHSLDSAPSSSLSSSRAPAASILSFFQNSSSSSNSAVSSQPPSTLSPTLSSFTSSLPADSQGTYAATTQRCADEHAAADIQDPTYPATTQWSVDELVAADIQDGGFVMLPHSFRSLSPDVSDPVARYDLKIKMHMCF